MAGAARLAAQHRVFERPLGVAGIWGAVIRAWLDELLPPDALERCQGRVQLVVTQVPGPRCLWGDCCRSPMPMRSASQRAAAAAVNRIVLTCHLELLDLFIDRSGDHPGFGHTRQTFLSGF